MTLSAAYKIHLSKVEDSEMREGKKEEREIKCQEKGRWRKRHEEEHYATMFPNIFTQM